MSPEQIIVYVFLIVISVCIIALILGYIYACIIVQKIQKYKMPKEKPTWKIKTTKRYGK